ncbi:MAG TPA: glycine cleavage system aminomethyltransferase GcvT [Syntrophales bacterium]|nr:glycine cleavage system aminomethyltransferase GcvT [Syntrophales bacterium]
MQKTPLYENHLRLGAKIVDFSGWAMPVQYTNVIDEHQATRGQAGLFDICHMGEFEVRGPRAFDLLQHVMSRDLSKQAVGQIKLSVMTNERGGILDDVTVYRLQETSYMVVTNAGTREKDLAWIRKQREAGGFSDVAIEDISDRTGKLDLQGPRSREILQPLVPADLASLPYFFAFRTAVAGVSAIVSRSGYTGEDGFEIYAAADRIFALWDSLLAAGGPFGMKPVGLGARDTLRLEAGMMLYGHELNETITPLEVVYGWVTDLEKDFIGAPALRRQKESGVQRKLVGFEMTERGIARAGYKVLAGDRAIGEVTSGSFAPTLGKAIGMAFVPPSLAAPGTAIDILIRSNRVRANVVKLPFYRRGK